MKYTVTLIINVSLNGFSVRVTGLKFSVGWQLLYYCVDVAFQRILKPQSHKFSIWLRLINTFCRCSVASGRQSNVASVQVGHPGNS